MGSQEGQVLAAGHSLPGFPHRTVVTEQETILLALAHLAPHKEAHVSSSTLVTCFLQLKLIILKQLSPANRNRLRKDWWPAELLQPHLC